MNKTESENLRKFLIDVAPVPEGCRLTTRVFSSPPMPSSEYALIQFRITNQSTGADLGFSVDYFKEAGEKERIKETLTEAWKEAVSACANGENNE